MLCGSTLAQAVTGGITENLSFKPVSYDIGNKLGSRDTFASMVKTCNAAGVGVLADVILNRELQSGTLSQKSCLTSD